MKLGNCCVLALIGLVPALLPPGAGAQLDGSFSLSKESFLAGEPIFLSFTVKNNGTQPLRIPTADPMSFCGGYTFELQGARDRDALPCMGGYGGSCLSSDTALAPGKSYTDHILLNRRYDLRQPGAYSLHVTHRIHYGLAAEDYRYLFADGIDQDFEDNLEIVIEPSQPDDLKPEFARYERDLGANDQTTRREAAQVIAYLAPAFMEPVIVSMLHEADLEEYGVEGLRNLGTQSAHRALGDFVQHAQPTNTTGPYQTALRYLGEIGDSSDIPILLDVATANAPDSASRDFAIESAGQAGGAAAVPALERELVDPSIDTQQDAVRALYLTGSRAAVPVLISLLRSPEWRVSGTAEFGLESLTHWSGADTKEMKPPPPDTYTRWLRWWTTQGHIAPIFKPDECGKIEPLPPL